MFLQGGFAYVPSEQLSVLVTGAFRAGLSKALTLTARRWATTTSLEEADRLTPVVEALSTQYLGSDYSACLGPCPPGAQTRQPGFAPLAFPRGALTERARRLTQATPRAARACPWQTSGPRWTSRPR